MRLPGRQTFEVRPTFTAAAVSATGRGDPPEVEVLVSSGGGEVVAARTTARRVGDDGWGVLLWVDGVAAVRLAAAGLRLCSLCFGIADEHHGWRLLREEPILLPVVDDGTLNLPAFLHDPAQTEAAAAARLSATLPAPARDELASRFARDLGALAEELVRHGRDAALPATPSEAGSARTPPSLDLPTMSVLALAAVDPDISRMLGLYWHDPVDGGTWDYKVVAHHGPVRYPGRTVTFGDLPAGDTWPGTLVRPGVALVGNAGLEVLPPADPEGPQALRLQAPRDGTVAGIRLDPPAPAVTLRLGAGGGAGPFTAWRGGTQVDWGTAASGEVSLDHGPGIDAVTWTVGPVDLLGVELHREAGLVGDLVAYAWRLAPEHPGPVRDLRLTEVAAAAESTRLHPDGGVDRATGVVGLDWDVPGGVQDVRQPVRVLVARAFRGTGDAPVPDGPFEPRNADRPALAATTPPPRRRDPPGPPVPHRWTERAVPAGWYAWRLRGIDAFGRLGRWSAEREVRVAPGSRPPPPDQVVASYLDPADPNLPAADRALAEADGAGLLVKWTWPAGRRIQAPQVEPNGEFRVLLRRGDPNLLVGQVLTVRDHGTGSRLGTDLAWSGGAAALAGELLRLGGASFEITGNGTGPDAWVEVRHLTAPTRRPVTGPFTIRLSEAGGLATDLGNPLAFERRLHAEPVGRPLRHASRVVAAAVASGNGATVILADPLPAGPAAPLPGCLVAGGIAFPVTRQTLGSSRLEVGAVVQADGSSALPVAGRACTVWGGAAYRAWLPGVVLRPSGGEALALGLVAVTTSDGDATVPDDPAWSHPGRGSLGSRPGRESRASRTARVTAPRRTPPPAVAVTLPPPQDGDIPADQAEPADWYGRARYRLGFAPSPGAAGYRVLRASTAALFDRDRVQRQSGTGPYAGGPFDDDGASEAWLAEQYPSLTVADLVADLDTHPAPAAVQAAWRGWSAWYYPRLRNREVMELAERPGNEEAFRPAHAGTVTAPPYRDTLDGRGLGRFVYRVRPVDASGNAGAWSAAFPLVEVRDVTPPAMPVLQSALGGENAVTITWRAGAEPDLAGYWVWRARRADALADVRRRTPHAELTPTPDAALQSWQDEGLVGLGDWYYRVAAVDRAGNVSAPTAVVKARPVDVLPPDPPEWVRAERAKRRASDGMLLPPDAPEDPADRYTPAVALEWTVAEDQATCMVERQASGERIFAARSGWLAASGGPRRFAWVDDGADPARVLTYRIRARDAAGNEQRYTWNPVEVPLTGGVP